MIEMKKVFLDIETTSRTADMGHITAIGLIKDGEKKIRFVETPKEEADALEWLKKEIEDCELIITWYGSGFDIPFLLTRAILLGVDLSVLMTIECLDLCEFFKEKFSMAKYSLEEVSKSFGIERKKKSNWKNMPSLYLQAISGNEEAKKEIIEHCEDDLRSLKEIYEKVEKYVEAWRNGKNA